MIWLAGFSFLCALGPAFLFLRNLSALAPPPAVEATSAPAAVLIPARDEARNIAAAVEAGLGSGVAEVIVLDDQSNDDTAQIVGQIAALHPTVRLITGQPLPPGWRGKNFACAQLAEATRQAVLIFVDADVQLAPGSAARMAAFLEQSGTQLASGVPREVTVTFSEQLLVPLIHFVLFGFLPLKRMRASPHPAYATGCGQLFVADAAAYRASGGHAGIRDRIHDGLTLPKKFREHGFRTDLFDATEMALCRMYRSDREVWHGFTKNTIEGLGSPALIGPATVVLLLGQVAPFVLLVLVRTPVALSLTISAVLCALLPRVAAAVRFRQRWGAVILHPLAMLVLVGMQWFGLARYLAGRSARWKGRSLDSLGEGA